MRSSVELVAVLVIAATCSLSNFSCANIKHLVLRSSIVVGMHRKSKVLVVTDALAVAAQRTNAELSNALVRLEARFLVQSNR